MTKCIIFSVHFAIKNRQEVKTSCEEWCVAVDRGPAGRYTKNHAYITDGGLAAEGGRE